MTRTGSSGSQRVERDARGGGRVDGVRAQLAPGARPELDQRVERLAGDRIRQPPGRRDGAQQHGLAADPRGGLGRLAGGRTTPHRTRPPPQANALSATAVSASTRSGFQLYA